MSLMEGDDVITRVERRRVSHPAAQTSLVNSTHTSRGGVKLGSHKTYMGALFFDPNCGYTRERNMVCCGLGLLLGLLYV